MTITYPSNPLAAVTHANPYPYYADLVARKPIYRDETLGLWVASSAAAVSAVLISDICRVRPLAEPVPRALLGSPAATLFQHFVRMNDGERHCPFKRVISATLQAIDIRSVRKQAIGWARFLLDESEPQPTSQRFQDFAFHLPVYVVASLLGVPQDRLPQVALWTGDFVRCLAPTSSAEQIEQGKLAAGQLFDLFRSLLTTQRMGSTGSLLDALAEQAKSVASGDNDVIIANSIGFLSQTYEATAGLIGNTVIALANESDVYTQVMADPGFLSAVIAEVLRYDPPVQNTRRFLAQDGSVAGQEMRKNDVVLVVLAAANRDPLANSNPDYFDPARKDRRSFAFGMGTHACPGDALATLIAQAGVEQLLVSEYEPAQLARAVSYRPSANGRIALLSSGVQI